MKSEKFEKHNKNKIRTMMKNQDLQKISKKWFLKTYKYEYSYHFKWLGRPIIQYPQDIIALQEIIWKIKPDLIIETGIARGGSLIFSASMLELIGKGSVIGVDIKIHSYNKKEIEKHVLFKRIKIFEGSSVDENIIKKITKIVKNKKKVIVILDSNHTHEHVLKELELYSKFVSNNSYLVVFDTVIDDLPNNIFNNRPWSKTSNPKSAIREFLKTNNKFVVDKEIDGKLLITAAPEGYLKRIKK